VARKTPEGAVHLAGCGRPTCVAVAVSLFSHHIPLSIVVLAGAGNKGNPAPHGPARFAQPFRIARIFWHFLALKSAKFSTFFDIENGPLRDAPSKAVDPLSVVVYERAEGGF
jgi:hypothetical protein